jgi:hypothetical protein
MSTMVITLAAQTVMLDGTTQPAGTPVGRIVAGPGFTPTSGPGTPAGTALELVADTGQVLWAAAAPLATVIPGLEFWARLTPAEQNAFMTYVGANPTSLATFVQILTTQINLASALTAQWMAFMVSIGAITALRVAVVLTPTNNGQ